MVFLIGHSQDAQFSQFYVSGLYLNPSLAGQEPNAYLSTNYRTQWRSIGFPFVSNQVSVVLPLKTKAELNSHKGGVGLSCFNDKSGDGSLKTLSVLLTGAYNLAMDKAGKNYLSFGLQGGFIQKSVDNSSFQWGSQYDPFLGYNSLVNANENNIISAKLYPDVNAGIIYYHNKSKDYSENKKSGFLGFSVYHINMPNESLIKNQSSRLPMLMRAHGGIEFKLSPKFSLTPNFLAAYQNNLLQANAGLYLGYRLVENNEGFVGQGTFVMGGSHRLKDAGIALVGFATKYWQIGFSYDFNTSDFRYATKSKGAYEISLVLRNVREEKLERFSTPRF